MKKITTLILSLIIAVTFCSCDNSAIETTTLEKTFDEKIQELAYIADLKKYDVAAEEKANILYLEYQSLSESEKESLENDDILFDVLRRAEVLTIAEVTTALAIEHIKSDLLRPSSFELVESLVYIDTFPFLSDDKKWEIEVAIDYSAQIKAGGFDRYTEIVYFYLPWLDGYKPYEPSRECLQNALIHSDERLSIFSHYIITDGILTDK